MELVVIVTVVTPATAAFDGQQIYDLVSLNNIKAELDITDTSKDALLKIWITQASAAVAKFCNRIFQVETVQDQIFPPRDYWPVPVAIGGEEPLQLKRYPIVAGTTPTVTENNIALTVADDFLVKYDAGQLIRLNVNGWPKRWPALPIVVQYQAGWSMSDPRFADVQEAVTTMIKIRYFAQKRDPMLRQENMPDAYEATYWFASGPGAAVGNMPPQVSAVLEKYRPPVL